MTRIAYLLGAVALSACSLEGVQPQSTPAPSAEAYGKAGTCFAVVSKAEDGSYALATGVGDGSAEPKAVYARGLSAAKVDAAVAKEREIMKVNPECFTTYVFDRAAADPASLAPAG